MNHSRRKAIKTGGGVLAMLFAAGVIGPEMALAQGLGESAFSMKTLAEAMRAVGAQSPATSDAIVIKAPSIAENGAVVPVSIESRLPGTESITLLVEKNPTPLVASFGIPAGTEGNISTRVKMGQTSDVYALVKADGKFFMAKQEIKITLGGCGG
ncbi:MAG: thiosulfate oxidation carrier protein SoxY [Burkholderiales bacterium]|nr:thiosulfate oxidation carrier protein SoxY [Burkholderiales bacterium]